MIVYDAIFNSVLDMWTFFSLHTYICTQLLLVFPILMSFSVIFLYGNNCVGGTKYESIVSYQQQRKQQKQKEQQRKKQKE